MTFFRNIKFVVILAITPFLAAGCINSPLSKSVSARGSVKQVIRVTTDKQRKKLVFWHIQSVGNISNVIRHSVARFRKENPDVDVEMVPYLNEPYKIKLAVAMSTRNPPDIFPTWGGGPLLEYIKAGQVRDITALMAQGDYQNRFPEKAIQTVRFGGRIWAVPVEGCQIAVIFYNTKLFQKYHLKIPRTYQELLALIRSLRHEGIIPFALANRTKWPGSMFFMYFVDRMGGPEIFARAAARKGASFGDQVFVKAGELVQQLVKMKAFPEGFNGLDYDTAQSRALLYSGKAAMELAGSWSIFYMRDENKKFYDRNLDFFPFPALEGGKGNPADLVGTMGDNFYSVSQSCRYPKEAFKLIQHLIDDQAVAERIAIGKIPPVRNVRVDHDPILQKEMKLIQEAPSIQLWYDQYLPPELSEKHLETCQALFDFSMSPEQAAAAMEKAARGYFQAEQ